jgi:(2Fe-2S) ferredoxin
MGHHKPKDEQPFVLEGRFLGFLFKDGYKVKYLKILTNNREWLIEVSKPLRKEISLDLPVGEWVQVSGWQTYSAKYLVPKLKADAVATVRPGQPSTTSPVLPQEPEKASPRHAAGKILVCGKSDCWKRGGKAVCAALKEELSDRNLEGQISVQTTGCMKHCKTGPNIVVMPDKKRYSRIRHDDVNEILDTHFAPARSVADASAPDPDLVPEPVVIAHG